MSTWTAQKVVSGYNAQLAHGFFVSNVSEKKTVVKKRSDGCMVLAVTPLLCFKQL
jgi:hypothetical protein